MRIEVGQIGDEFVQIFTKDDWERYVERENNRFLLNKEAKKFKQKIYFAYYVTEIRNGWLEVRSKPKIILNGQPEIDFPFTITYFVPPQKSISSL